MKNLLTKEMQEKVIIGCAIAAFTVVFYFIIKNVPLIADALVYIFGLCLPFVIGFVIAFFLNPIVTFLEEKIFSSILENYPKRKRFISCLLTFILVIIFIILIGLAVVPSVVTSISDLMTNAPSYVEHFGIWVTNIVSKYHLDNLDVDKIVGSSGNVMKTITSIFTEQLPTLLNAGYSFISIIIKVMVGVFAAFYLLIDKENFCRGIKMINFAVFPKVVADYFYRMVNVFKEIFYNFIIGKFIDSMIIALLAYLVFTIVGIHYSLLFAVFIGITNMIPVFGPFIGAFPGLVILIMIDPIEALIFSGIVLIIQQLDGNVIGPMILGNRLNVGSFWIIFSVTLGGALYGVIGMFVGVPVFAFLYFGIKEFINYRLELKNIDVDKTTIESVSEV